MDFQVGGKLNTKQKVVIGVLVGVALLVIIILIVLLAGSSKSPPPKSSKPPPRSTESVPPPPPKLIDLPANVGDTVQYLFKLNDGAVELCAPTDQQVMAWGTVGVADPKTGQMGVRWTRILNPVAPKCCWSRTASSLGAASNASDLKYLGDEKTNPTYLNGTAGLSSQFDQSTINNLIKVDPSTILSCPPVTPDKCCWNRVIQPCNKDDDCDPYPQGSADQTDSQNYMGARRCRTGQFDTHQYGTSTCDTCQSRGKKYDSSTGSCK